VKAWVQVVEEVVDSHKVLVGVLSAEPYMSIETLKLAFDLAAEVLPLILTDEGGT
jgi:hypothetical protein